jgi:hypothetical protein
LPSARRKRGTGRFVNAVLTMFGSTLLGLLVNTQAIGGDDTHS